MPYWFGFFEINEECGSKQRVLLTCASVDLCFHAVSHIPTKYTKISRIARGMHYTE
jgi:hypothetical protein